MGIQVVKGQKVDVTKGNPALRNLRVELGWQHAAGQEIDASAFLLGSSGKVSSDEDLIFYNNRTTPFIRYADEAGSVRTFEVKLDRVPGEVSRIAFTLTLYDRDGRRPQFGEVRGIYLRILELGTGAEAVRCDLEHTFSSETAIVAGELYRLGEEWKFGAIASGFNGGLKELCRHFGVNAEDSPAPPASDVRSAPPIPEMRSAPPARDLRPAPPVAEPRPAPPAGQAERREPMKFPPPPGARRSPGEPAGEEALRPAAESPRQQERPDGAAGGPPTSGLNLQKIELKKKGDRINLNKSAGLGEILVNLNWNMRRSGGLLGRSKGVDLDLACLYELSDGRKGVVQALGRSFGSLQGAPYVALDGDDRTGAVAGGENLRINGARIAEIRRILVFAFIYEGATNWSEADGVVTLRQNGGPDIVVSLDEHDNRKGMCAIALISNVNNETFSIERLVQYYRGHREMDEAHRWGMRWVSGKK
ncbi:TerD family protein [Paenibacillus sp. HN-1]|uniref:TerD family protein n=1 Tax=Paenibacillus TaxID=44249 RepID=UPI001CA904F8|nr:MULTISPECIES: TerD family protein [Paenibacillus]MBY9080091.1 TerD family protein [Paenibacillus sp. CGMCC 1.18879]MBY9086789.1 TerD family protein [Paenibacillus sinensis]